LNDGRFLRVAISLFIDYSDHNYLKVSTSSFQYQVGPDPNVVDDWIFRYDYLRLPTKEPHPAAHMQVNATLNLPDVLPRGTPLKKVHFATRRVPLEAVLEVLADEFGVRCNERPDIWRPALREAGKAFATIAHDPAFGTPHRDPKE
jgi:hypothetical protein